jgi:hypothetical protein
MSGLPFALPYCDAGAFWMVGATLAFLRPFGRDGYNVPQEFKPLKETK